MNGDPEDGVSRERRLDEAYAKYLSEVEAGRTPERSEFLARYPDLAESLADVLGADERVRSVLDSPGSAEADTVSHCPRCEHLLETQGGRTTCRTCGWQLPPGLVAPP